MPEEPVDPRKLELEALARKPPEVTIVSDHTLAGEECYRDRFNLVYRLGPVLDVIRHPQTDTPMSIAIYGDWGTGKTSAMKWLEHLLNLSNQELTARGRSRIKTVWFDPWKYHSKEDVWRGLISEVIIKSIDVDTATMGTVVNAAKKFGLFLGRSFIHVLAGLKVKGKVSAGTEETGASVEAEYSLSSIKEILAEYQEAAHPENAFLNEFETELRNWIKTTLDDDERMVVFIDDLDRCMPNVALNVLEALKLYLNIKKLIFVVGVDRIVIDELVKGYYQKLNLSGDKSKHYLAKMFQVEVQLAPRHMQVREFLGEQLEKVDYWSRLEKEEQDIFQKVILSLSVHNPREIKRLVNSALMSAAGFVMLPELGEIQGITFCQGLQQYFVCKILEKPIYNMADVLRAEAAHRFFRQWSDIIAAHLDETDFPRTIDVSTKTMASKRRKLGARLQNEPEVADSEITQAQLADHVRSIYAVLLDEKEYARFLALLSDEDLAELMRIPYPEKEGAAMIRQVAVSSNDSDPYLQAIAVELGKEPDRITKEDYLQVTELNLDASAITDLTPLHELENLQELSISQTEVIDLTPLRELTKMRHLDLWSTKVRDITPLRNLSNLEYLDLDGTQVTDIALLHELKMLEELDISNTKVVDFTPLQGLENLRGLTLQGSAIEDLAPLRGLLSLESLDLQGTQVTDITPLHELKELGILNISHTKVMDLTPLQGLENLRELSLGGNVVEDLTPLRRLTHLWHLNLQGSRFSDKQIVDLKEALPTVKISW